jgi:hypothetical protein
MIRLCRGLVGSVLEYGSVYYSGMAWTHILRLERVQYRGIKIALELVGSTPNKSLVILSSIAPLAEKFVYLNFRYLVPVPEEIRDLEGAEFGSLYYGLLRCFATEYSLI